MASRKPKKSVGAHKSPAAKSRSAKSAKVTKPAKSKKAAKVTKPAKAAKVKKPAKAAAKSAKSAKVRKPAKSAKSAKAVKTAAKKSAKGAKVRKPAKVKKVVNKPAQKVPAQKVVGGPKKSPSNRGVSAKTSKTATPRPSQQEAGDAEVSAGKKYTPNIKEKYMSERQVRYFRDNLYRMLRDIDDTAARTIDALRGSDQSTPDENDRASKEADFALELRERERESFLVNKIRHALQRIKSKDFGYCEECGDRIGLPRLLARPVATLCFECKNLQEYKEKIHS